MSPVVPGIHTPRGRGNGPQLCRTSSSHCPEKENLQATVTEAPCRQETL